MTEIEVFDKLKREVLKEYLDYIDEIKNFNYEDTQNTKKRLQLIESYNKTVVKNLDYREFIRKIIPLNFTK